MPLIQLKFMEQVFTPTRKKEIVSKLTDTVVPFEGENIRPRHPPSKRLER